MIVHKYKWQHSCVQGSVVWYAKQLNTICVVLTKIAQECVPGRLPYKSILK